MSGATPKFQVPDHRPPWALPKSNGPLKTPDTHEFVTRSFATQFIAERMDRDFESMRRRRDKIGKRIDTAIQNETIPCQGRKFKFGYLVAWALKTKDLAKTVEGLLPIGRGQATLTAPSFQMSSTGYSVPETLDACRTALHEVSREVLKLRDENLELKVIIDGLLTYKEKADARSLVAQLAGKRGGRPRIQEQL